MKIINKIFFIFILPLYTTMVILLVISVFGIIMLEDELKSGFRKVFNLLD